MGFLTKRDKFTLFTPIPGFVPRQLAVTLLHDHDEVLEANPLVLAHWPTPCPSHARVDEQFAIWYEITQRIQYLPGFGSKGAGTIRFTGCFQDQPWGLQTHIYAPMGVDLRNVYRIAGFQPGSPRMPGEFSDVSSSISGASENAPTEGLYLRTDVEVESSIGFSRFVRAQTKNALQTMVSRMVKRVEELDAKELREMLDNEKQGDHNIADNEPYPSHPPPPQLSAPPANKTATTTAVAGFQESQHSPQPAQFTPQSAEFSPPPAQPSPLFSGQSPQPSPLFSAQSAQPSPLFSGQSSQPSPLFSGQSAQPSPHSANFGGQPAQSTPQPGHFGGQQGHYTPQYGQSNPQQAPYNPHHSHPLHLSPQPPQFSQQPAQIRPHSAQFNPHPERHSVGPAQQEVFELPASEPR